MVVYLSVSILWKKRVRVVVQTKIVIRRLRKCYKNIQMKADDITKLTAELKSDSVYSAEIK